jgi:diacylglycerol O-acyltransferase
MATEMSGVATVGEAVPLQAEDLAILALECPTIVGHTCKVIGIAPGGLDAAAVRARVESRLAASHVLTRRLGGPAKAPAWVPDPDFDLSHHVVSAPVSSPVDESGLRRVVGDLFAQHLDRERPLWRMDVAPLADGGTAVIWRIHHALADGTTTMRWARELLWDEPEESASAAAAAHAADEARRRRHLASFVSREYARSSGRSPFDGLIGSQREIGLATLPLGAVKRAAHSAAGATLNDALLSILAGSVRHYIQAHHGRLTDIRVRVPVSLHHEGDAVANRDSFFSLALPLHIEDPVERLRFVHAETELRKSQHDAELADELLSHLSKAQAMQRLVTRMNNSPRRFAVCVSNVPGPRVPVSVTGLPVNSLVGLAEIGERHGLRVAAVSLHDNLSLGFCVDPALVPEVQSMADFAALEADALIAAGS